MVNIEYENIKGLLKKIEEKKGKIKKEFKEFEEIYEKVQSILSNEEMKIDKLEKTGEYGIIFVGRNGIFREWESEKELCYLNVYEMNDVILKKDKNIENLKNFLRNIIDYYTE